MRDIHLYNLQLVDLELFLAVAESGSFTRAGEMMFMTQSWVSKRISLMERELDLNLLIRSKREVILTPAGRVLEERLRRIYSVWAFWSGAPSSFSGSWRILSSRIPRWLWSSTATSL